MARQGAEYLNSPTKRRLDVIGGATIAAALLPPGALAAFISEIDTRSLNPIFKQDRIGRFDSRLQVRKFRTISESKKAGQEEVYGTFDPRASKLGLMMREVGIDEMPQLINVIKGEMSLVGLRPMLQATLDEIEDASPRLYKKWHPYYTEFRHGLTGPSQFLRHQYKQMDKGIWAEVMEMDLAYIKRASLRNDLKVLGSTPLKMLQARIHMIDNSAPAPAEVPATPEGPGYPEAA